MRSSRDIVYRRTMEQMSASRVFMILTDANFGVFNAKGKFSRASRVKRLFRET